MLLQSGSTNEASVLINIHHLLYFSLVLIKKMSSMKISDMYSFIAFNFRLGHVNKGREPPAFLSVERHDVLPGPVFIAFPGAHKTGRSHKFHQMIHEIKQQPRERFRHFRRVRAAY